MVAIVTCSAACLLWPLLQRQQQPGSGPWCPGLTRERCYELRLRVLHSAWCCVEGRVWRLIQPGPLSISQDELGGWRQQGGWVGKERGAWAGRDMVRLWLAARPGAAMMSHLQALELHVQVAHNLQRTECMITQ
jgi:hypothetical protein